MESSPRTQFDFRYARLRHFDREYAVFKGFPASKHRHCIASANVEKHLNSLTIATPADGFWAYSHNTLEGRCGHSQASNADKPKTAADELETQIRRCVDKCEDDALRMLHVAGMLAVGAEYNA